MFASCIVGPWIANPREVVSPPIREEVDEVMRSCGGAIQGIREIPLMLSDVPGEEKERIYHNRADGGFVYADDGTYSAGPGKLDASEIKTLSSKDKLIMASLAFPDRRRLLMTIDILDIFEASCHGIVGIRQLSSSKVLELSRSVLATSIPGSSCEMSSIATLETTLPLLNWDGVRRVRMSNSDQTWSLARAKWEKQDVKTGNDDDATRMNRSETASLMGCSYIETISDNTYNSLFGDIIKADTINLHMLAVCPVSNVARSVVRCYDSNGLLKSVAFAHGSISKH